MMDSDAVLLLLTLWLKYELAEILQLNRNINMVLFCQSKDIVPWYFHKNILWKHITMQLDGTLVIRSFRTMVYNSNTMVLK